MEKKAIVVIGALATVVAMVVVSGVAYAAIGPFSGQNTRNNSMMGHDGYGGSMMGRTAGYSGMMGDNDGSNRACSCTENCPGSTSLP